MEPLERGVAFLNVSKYGCKRFLNKEPLEWGLQAVSKELQTVGNSFYLGNHWNHKFLNMEPLERGVAIQFLNREPLETPVSKYGTVGAGSCKQFLNREPLEPPFSKYGTVETEGCLPKRF